MGLDSDGFPTDLPKLKAKCNSDTDSSDDDEDPVTEEMRHHFLCSHTQSSASHAAVVEGRRRSNRVHIQSASNTASDLTTAPTSPFLFNPCPPVHALATPVILMPDNDVPSSIAVPPSSCPTAPSLSNTIHAAPALPTIISCTNQQNQLERCVQLGG